MLPLFNFNNKNYFFTPPLYLMPFSSLCCSAADTLGKSVEFGAHIV